MCEGWAYQGHSEDTGSLKCISRCELWLTRGTWGCGGGNGGEGRRSLQVEKPRLQRLERLVGDVNGLQWEERTEAMVETCRRSR